MDRFVAVLALSALLCGCGAQTKGLSIGTGGGSSASPSQFGPQYAKAAHCGDLTSKDVPNFFILSGERVPLPADSSLAHDATIVQPGNVPIERYSIGLDDGTGVCAVYMPDPPVPVGGHLSLVVQAVRAKNGGVWFGWVNIDQTPPGSPPAIPSGSPH